ncbi:MAG: hypothetical protein RL322_794 [Pseudomonadota bacterium]|jgi:ABC-type branched-subunit amino acid transport system ATPase component
MSASAQSLSIRSIRRTFGGVVALDQVSFDIEGPGIYGLIGPNGAGKTTLFDTVAGIVRPDAGQVLLGGQDVTGWPSHRIASLGVARTFQECRVLPEESCLDNILYAAQPKRLGSALAQVFTRSDQTRRQFNAEARRLLDLVRLSDYAQSPASSLSFGQRRLLEIVCTFIKPCRLLLLDEPAAGVNPSLLQVLGDFIKVMHRERPSVILLVEHNMEFIMSMADEIIVMHQGRVLERGTPAAVQASAAVREAYLG